MVNFKNTLTGILGTSLLAVSSGCTTNKVSLGYGYGYSPDSRIQTIDGGKSDTVQIEYAGNMKDDIGFEIGFQLGEARRATTPQAEIVRKRLFFGGRYTLQSKSIEPYISAGLAVVEVQARRPDSMPHIVDEGNALGPYAKLGIDFNSGSDLFLGLEVNYTLVPDVNSFGGRDNVNLSETQYLLKLGFSF